eukprot:m.179436 g.179436  ORF g.179436 m.179436 type:complete len:312 (-) comp14765_c0_seq1:189-1124(-)
MASCTTTTYAQSQTSDLGLAGGDETATSNQSTGLFRRGSRRNNSSRRRSSSHAHQSPFFQAANNPPGTHTQLYFEAKYYGACPSIPTEGDNPPLDNVIEMMTARKADGLVTRCVLYFSERGLVLTERKTNRGVAAWLTRNMASCATIKHPSAKGRRIGLFKIRDPDTNALTWHLFKYYTAKADHMSDCFRFVVDCSLRDIGKQYAAQVAAEPQLPLRPEVPSASASAWVEHVPPPYEDSVVMQIGTDDTVNGAARRKLIFGEAELEAADIAAGASRQLGTPDELAPVYPSFHVPSDDGITSVYLEVDGGFD